MDSLTVPHILDKTVDDLKCQCCRHTSLILSKSVEPLKNPFDFILSEKLVYKDFCIALSQTIHQRKQTHLIVFV